MAEPPAGSGRVWSVDWVSGSKEIGAPWVDWRYRCSGLRRLVARVAVAGRFGVGQRRRQSGCDGHAGLSPLVLRLDAQLSAVRTEHGRALAIPDRNCRSRV